MAEAFAAHLQAYLAQYGYWTLAVTLLLENAGLPVPGETVLLTASFVAFSTGRLRLALVIAIGSAAAALGDNIGFAVGHWGGRPLLTRLSRRFHFSGRAIARGEQLFARYGAEAIFVARFVFGLRVIAGPLAGVLRMPWRRFALFNALGAVTWVTAIASVGYVFGREWPRVVPYLKGFDVALIAIILGAAVVVYMRLRRSEAS